MSSSTLDEDFEEFDDFDEEDDEEEGFSGLLVLVMGLLMFGAMVMVVWVAYRHGVKMGEARIDPPYVAADPEPVKIERPEETAMSGSPSREVYDQFDGGADEEVSVIASAPEEPVSRDIENPIVDLARNAGAEEADGAVGDRIAALAAAAEAAEDEPDTPAADAVVLPDSERPESERVAAAPETPTRKEPEARAATRPTPAAVSAPVETAAAVSALSGSHLVQLAALSSEDEADKAWRAIEGKLGDYLAGKAPDIMSPTGADDVYYRLRVGPFASRDEASEYCEGLKSRGQNCLVRAK